MLFESETYIDLNLADAELRYYPHYFSRKESLEYFKTLRDETDWKADRIRVYGKWYDQPRLTALYANTTIPYSYSNITMHPHPFTPTLENIKTQLETTLAAEFSTCLLNLYRNGHDSNGWHADDEKELGKNPIIASVSFGAERRFRLKHKTHKNLKHDITLQDGSLLLMKGGTQHHWLHQVPKTKKNVGERINLTFRLLK